MSETQLFAMLQSIAALVREDEERTLPPLGLTMGRAHVLWILSERGASKQADIATRMDVTPRHVTTLVDELVAQGIVRRVPHPTDRRAVLVTPSERGQALLVQMARAHDAAERRLITAVPTERRAEFLADLGRVRDRLGELVYEDHA